MLYTAYKYIEKTTDFSKYTQIIGNGLMSISITLYQSYIVGCERCSKYW